MTEAQKVTGKSDWFGRKISTFTSGLSTTNITGFEQCPEARFFVRVMTVNLYHDSIVVVVN